MVVVEKVYHKEVPSEESHHRLFHVRTSHKTGKFLPLAIGGGDRGRQRRQWTDRKGESSDTYPFRRPSVRDLTQIRSSQTLDLLPRRRLLLRSDLPRLRHRSREAEDTLRRRFGSQIRLIPDENQSRWSKEKVEKSSYEREKLDTRAIGVVTDG